jgi:hypothetical protein
MVSCVTVKSRDMLLALRSTAYRLKPHVRARVKFLGCARRGCRAGRRVLLRRQSVYYAFQLPVLQVPSPHPPFMSYKSSSSGGQSGQLLTSCGQCNDEVAMTQPT